MPHARSSAGTSVSASCDGRDRDLVASDTACLGVCATSIAAAAAFRLQLPPPAPPLAVEETDALGTLITIAFEVALPPEPPVPPKRKGAAGHAPPAPPVAVAVAKPLPAPSAVLVAAVAAALPPAPPLPRVRVASIDATARTAGSACRVRSVTRVAIRWRYRGCGSAWPTVDA